MSMMHSIAVDVEIVEYKSIDRLASGWSSQDYRAVLTALEIDDVDEIADADLLEMVQMALADLPKPQAAEALVHVRVGSRLKEGQIDDAAHAMLDEKLWEEFADLTLHETFFNIGQLLFDAFNGGFPKPKAARVQVRISAAADQLATVREVTNEAKLTCLLAQQLPENARLRRFFPQQISSGTFPEAEHILWTCQVTGESEGALEFEIIGSHYWLEPLDSLDNFSAKVAV